MTSTCWSDIGRILPASPRATGCARSRRAPGSISPPTIISALAESPELAEAAAAALARGVPVGAGGSRLLRGNHPEHEALEADAARFFRAESALFFGAGFSANEALLSTLPQRDDLIVHDALIHASAHEGMRLSRAPSRSLPT